MINRSRPTLFSLPKIAIIVLVAIVTLYLLYPESLFFEKQEQSSDLLLTKSYVEATLAADPNDADAKTKLADIEIQLGNLDRAQSLLAQMPETPITVAMTKKVLFQQWTRYGAKNDSHYDELKAALHEPQSWVEQDLKYAQALGLETELAEYYEFHQQPLLAAKQWTLSGHPEKAYELYKQNLSVTTVDDAVSTALAVNKPAVAYQWWKKYGDGDPKNQLRLAQLSGDAEETQAAAKNLYLAHPDDLDVMEEVMLVLLATGDQHGAQKLLVKLLNRKPEDASLHHLHWQVSQWLDMPTTAVNEVLWLMHHDLADKKMVNDSINAANTLFLYDQPLKMYRYLLKKKWLASNQLNDWMNVHYYNGDLTTALKDIERFEYSNNPTSVSQYWKAKLLFETGDMKGLRSLWPKYRGENTQEVVIWFARSFWLVKDYSQALVVLKHTPAETDSEYWSVRSNIANSAGDSQDELYALERLKKISTLASYDEYRFMQLKFSLATQDKDKLTYLWSQTLTPDILTQIAQTSWESNDFDSLKKVHGILSKMESSPELLDAWLYVAYGYENNQQYDQAKSALLHAHFSQPDSYQPQIALSWLALASNDFTFAKRILANYQHISPNEIWSPVIASLAMYTNNWQVAYRHLQWLHKQSPNDISIMVNLSDALSGLGRAADAYRMNLYLLLHIPKSEEAYKELQTKWMSDEDVFYYLYRTHTMDSIAARLPTLTYSNWWLKRHAVTKLTPWQTLQNAINNGDTVTIANLLNTGTLSDQDQINSLLALRRPYKAMESWYQHADDLPESEKYNLARQVRASNFRAVEFNFEPEAGLSSHQSGVNIYIPAWEQEWKFSAAEQSNLYNSGNVFALSDAYDAGRWQLSAALDHHQGELVNRTGYLIEANYQWSSRLQVGLGASINQESRQNEILLALGQQSSISAQMQYQLDSYQQLQASANYLTIDTRRGESLTSGMQYDARYQFTLLKDRPTWTVYSSVSWQDFSGQNQYQIADLPNTAFTIDPFRRFAIGTTLSSNAQELNPPYLGASLVWLIDISTGYQSVTDQLDFVVNGGIGTTVLGDDLLKLQVGYQTSNSTGREDTQLTLGYYIHF